jgi:hypothetical protein
MLNPLPSSADRAVARANATAVAALIGVPVRTQRRNALGEPDCPYKLRWNVDPFWFGVGVSDRAYVVQGNHQRPYSSAIALYASLKTPDGTMLTRLPLERLSKELGVSVFVNDAKYGASTAAAFRSDECNRIVRSLLFVPIRSLFVSPVQIYAISDFVTPEQCAQQVTLLRGLLLAVWRWSCRVDGGSQS